MGKAITFLPSPLPGEHFLSVIARWGILQGKLDIRNSLESLSTQALMLSHKYIHHPMSDDVIARYGSGLERDQVLRENTLVPYYGTLLTYSSIYSLIHQKQYHKWYVKKSRRKAKQNTPSACYNTMLKFGEKWRWCEECVVEDEKHFGITYWHVLHQIPSVLHCSKHPDVALSVGCDTCGFVVTDLCKTPLPPIGNRCPRCKIYIPPVNYQRSSHIAWIEDCSLQLQHQKGVLSSPEFGHIMKYGVQGQFSYIVGNNTRQKVFIADRLQREFTQWLTDNGLGVFFNEPEKISSEKVLDIEAITLKASRRPPVSILLWLRYLDAEWPSLNSVA